MTQSTDSYRIPNIIHFCFGLAPDARFGILEYLAVRSAVEVNQPDQVLFHYQHEPSGPWWELARPLLSLNRVEAPTEVFGKPVSHYAHQADVVRMQALLKWGGIYLDIDTLCLRPFTGLRVHPFVMGKQPRAEGLCNAVMLAEPAAVFLRTWWDEYRTFRADKWDEHSVFLPYRLAQRPDLRSHIHIESDRAFFFPHWEQMDLLFAINDSVPFDQSYCIHYWQTLTREVWLSRVTEQYLRTHDNNITRFASRYIVGTAVASPPPHSDRLLKYDLGGVGRGRDGYLTVNLHGACDIRYDICDLDGFIPQDEVVDEFRLSHTLEHIQPLRYRQFLLDMKRKLRTGGRVVVIQTDAGAVIRQWLNGDLSWRSMRGTLMPPASRLEKNALNLHYNMWTPDELVRDFAAIGMDATTFDAGAWRFDLDDPLCSADTARDQGVRIRNLGVVATKTAMTAHRVADAAARASSVDRTPDIAAGISPPSLVARFDRVICVNLERRPEFWATFQANVATVDWPFKPIQRMAAVDGHRTGAARYWNHTLGVWGCYRSHVRALEDALNDGVDTLMVMEDDAHFPADFACRVATFLDAVPDDWDQIFFGGRFQGSTDLVNEHVLRATGVVQTHCYAIRGPFIRTMYEFLCSFTGGPGREGWADVDQQMALIHRDRAYKIYCPRHWLVHQRRHRSDTKHAPGTENVKPKPHRPPLRPARAAADLPHGTGRGAVRDGARLYSLLRRTWPIDGQCADVSVTSRRSICEQCHENLGVDGSSIRCRASRGAVVSLMHGKCPLRKWPASTMTVEPIVAGALSRCLACDSLRSVSHEIVDCSAARNLITLTRHKCPLRKWP